MNSKTIVFTKPQTAELLDKEIGKATGDFVKVKMEYTVVSGGTERACIMGMNNESYPHHWTHHDDCRAILDMISANRIDVQSIVSRVVKPEDAPAIYTELCNNKDFPIGTVFDWK